MSMASRAPVRLERRSASGPAGDALGREAQILAHARHPGVAELIDVRVNATTTEIETAVPDGLPLRRVALSIEELAGVMATVATTVADLHDIGVAHGAITIDGVVIGDDGRAVLTDFTRSAWLDGPPSKWPAHRAARRDARALGDLLTALVDRCAPQAVLAPMEESSRWSRLLRRVGRRRIDDPVSAVRRWAADSAAGAVSCRRLAEGLATEIPGACLPRRASGAERPHATVVPPAATNYVSATTTGGAPDPWSAADPLGAAANDPMTEEGGDARDSGQGDTRSMMSDETLERWFATSPGRGSAQRGHETHAASPRRATRIRHAAPVGVGMVLAAVLVAGTRAITHPAAAGPASCPPGPSRCATYRDGSLTVGSGRYDVGKSGDLAVIGRWACGPATLALLRPTTGDVWVYGTWPTDDAPVRPVLDASIPGARALAARPRHGCDTLVATLSDGRRVDLPTAHAP
jgi:hypothetical protein